MGDLLLQMLLDLSLPERDLPQLEIPLLSLPPNEFAQDQPMLTLQTIIAQVKRLDRRVALKTSRILPLLRVGGASLDSLEQHLQIVALT